MHSPVAWRQHDDLYLGGTTDVQAYDPYLLGRQKWVTRDVPALREAIRHFEDAIARDSSFALAWSGLADAIDGLAWRAPDARGRVPADGSVYVSNRGTSNGGGEVLRYQS